MISPVARVLDRLARLEASLIGTRLEIDRALDMELEELRALRKELLAAQDEQCTGSGETAMAGKIVEFVASTAGSPATSSTGVAQVELAPLLEGASLDDLSDALAAVFRKR